MATGDLGDQGQRPYSSHCLNRDLPRPTPGCSSHQVRWPALTRHLHSEAAWPGPLSLPVDSFTLGLSHGTSYQRLGKPRQGDLCKNSRVGQKGTQFQGSITAPPWPPLHFRPRLLGAWLPSNPHPEPQRPGRQKVPIKMAITAHLV